MTGIENAVASCCLEGRDPENSIAGEMIALLLELVLKIASRLLAAPPFLSSLCSPGDGGEIPGVPPRLISYLFPYCVSCFVKMSLKASCSALSSHRGQSSALTTRRGRVRRSRCCFLSFPLHATGSQEKKIEKKKEPKPAQGAMQGGHHYLRAKAFGTSTALCHPLPWMHSHLLLQHRWQRIHQHGQCRRLEGEVVTQRPQRGV